MGILPQQLSLKSVLASLPPPPQGDLRSKTRTLLHSKEARLPILIALDDDPTGTQTCHDITVLTVWDVETLIKEFRSTPRGSGFFILTNSRALHTPEARTLTIEICKNLQEAAKATDTPFEIVLRGDSTLRGHFPAEPEAVDKALGIADAWILCPFFLQGGRYTIDDIHYVAEGDLLVPAGETPFARDGTFGYKSSNLRDWVVEKSKGSIKADAIVSLSLASIRTGGPGKICEELTSMPKGSVVIVNAAAEEDIDVVVLGILEGKYSCSNP
jgi:uncharacterized protein YgbK (DUF1537 family)